MTASTKTNETPAQTPHARSRRESEPGREGADGTQVSGAGLEELARAQGELTQEVRRLVARDALTDGPDAAADDRERAGRMLSTARSELLDELLREQQERARRQLAEASRSGEEAVAGVVRSIATVVRALVPSALVRPQELIEATFAVADQSLRIGRRLALAVGEAARDLPRAA